MNGQAPEELNHFTPADLAALVPRLSWRRVLVLGDLFLDEYVEGRATRLSREAPIPVLEFERRFYLPGGAANPAHNIAALQGHAWQSGVIGDDAAGRQLLAELQRAGVDARGVVVDAGRPTTTKTRVVSRGSLRFPQQVARIDHIDRRPIDAGVQAAIEAHLRGLLPQADALLVSDYRSGVMTPALSVAALELAKASGKPATVDSQGNLEQYRGYHLIKCNQAEAEAMLKRPLDTVARVREACEDLLDNLQAEMVVVTRGADGIAGLSRREGFTILPAANRSEVYDVVGAGDTVIAVLTLALAARLPFGMALRLANYAAGLVVRKLGNATATQAELCWAIEHW